MNEPKWTTKPSRKCRKCSNLGVCISTIPGITYPVFEAIREMEEKLPFVAEITMKVTCKKPVKQP